MGLHVLSQEVHAELVGFPLSVTSPPQCTCGDNEACSACGVSEIQFDAGERDDGAVGSRLVIRGTPEQLRAAFTEALSYVSPV